MPEVVVFVGVQGSGKTSFYWERFAETHLHLSKDLLRSVRRKQARIERDLRAALEAGRSVVIDNTHPARADRAALLAIAREAGTQARGFYFQSRIADCLARNAARSGRARVPEVAVKATHARLELPSLAEGFDALFYVALEATGFRASPWEEA